MSYGEYNWYKEKNEEQVIDYNKPIFCIRGRDIEILLPVQVTTKMVDKNMGETTYEIIGYDWFNITDGHWNSCKCWHTPEEAVAKRPHVSNANFHIGEGETE